MEPNRNRERDRESLSIGSIPSIAQSVGGNFFGGGGGGVKISMGVQTG